MKEERPRVNVDILVVRSGKLLLGKLSRRWSRSGEWGVPGRDIRFGERIGAAVRRYARTELGCTVTNYKIISVNANYAGGKHYLGIGVVVEIKGKPKLRLQKDWLEWRWFPKSALPKLFPAARNVIRSCFQKKVSVSE